MKILQINTTDIKGGAAVVAFNLHTELAKMGHEMTMFVGRKYSNDPKVKVLNDILSLSGKIRKKLAYWLANDIDVFSSDHLLETEEYKKADIIHCHNLHSNYFNLTTLQKIKKPIIWTFHDMWPITSHCAHAFDGEVNNGFFTCPSNDIFPPIAWGNDKYLESKKLAIYNKSDFKIVIPSKWLEGKVRQTILNNKSINLIRNGVDTNIFKPMNKQLARTELGLPQDKKIILFIGKKNSPWKGEEFFEAVRSKYQNHLFIWLSGNIENLAKYYSSADILLYPSIADNCPLVVLEAQACGLPVVAFNTGGVPEIIEHKKTGWIAEYKNLKELLTGIDYILTLDEDSSKLLANNAIASVKDKFSLELMTKNYLNFYNSLLS